MRINRLPLKIRRVVAGLTQRQVCERLGCSQALLSNIERGRVSLQHRIALAYLELLREAEKSRGRRKAAG